MDFSDRNKIVSDKYIIEPVEDFSIFNGFSCGDHDLDDFICNDAVHYSRELLAVTYAYRLRENENISDPIAFASIMNDAIRITTNRQRRKIPNSKRWLPQFPAVKIGRLGVRKEFQKMHFGETILAALRDFFVTNNRTGCRYMTVDAYETVVGFYENNHFQILAEEEGRKKREGKKKRNTVSMFLDLKRPLPS